MKTVYYITFLTVLSCNNKPKQVDKTFQQDTTQKITERIDNSSHYTNQGTVQIVTEIDDTLIYSKTEFNNIVDKHPEFFQKYPDNPDQTYYNDNDKQKFGSEAGQDTYYMLYAYFLKQRNGDKQFATQRQKLIDIYSNINSLFGHFEYGGTYFGHQSRRILAYAEYSIHLLPKQKTYISKKYDIAKQKQLYIQSLRQLVNDESSIDFNTLGNEKIKRNKELNDIVDNLDSVITDNFYLKRTQEFQYGHYEYY